MKNNDLLLPIVVLVVALIAAILLFFVVKKDQVISPKKTILVILLGAIILAVPSTLIYVGVPYIPTLYMICALYNLLMGWAYVAYYPNMLISPNQDQWWMQILILLITALIGAALFIIIFHYLSDIDYDLMVGLPISFVFVPLFFARTLNALLSIPVEIYKIWHYSEGQQTNWFDDHFNVMFVFEIELYKNQNDSNLTKVKAKAPKTIIFKDWFQRFLDDFNKKYPKSPIECTSYGNQHFGWIFYVKPSFWPVKRYIDFEKTIYENEIDDRSVIVAKRVVEDRFVQPEIYLTQEGPEESTPVAKNPTDIKPEGEVKPKEEASEANGGPSVVEQKGDQYAQSIKSQGVNRVEQAGQKLFTDHMPKI